MSLGTMYRLVVPYLFADDLLHVHLLVQKAPHSGHLGVTGTVCIGFDGKV